MARVPTSKLSKLLVRLPSRLRDDLKALAASRETTLNAVCRESLENALAPPPASSPAVSPAIAALGPILSSALEPDLDAVILFGSQARGQVRPGSDTDLLLCLARGTKLTRELYHRWDAIARSHPREISDRISPHFALLPSSPEQAGALWFEVAIDGIVLWDRRLAVSRFLVHLRRHLLSDRAVRKSSYGIPYWVKANAKSAAR